MLAWLPWVGMASGAVAADVEIAMGPRLVRDEGATTLGVGGSVGLLAPIEKTRLGLHAGTSLGMPSSVAGFREVMSASVFLVVDRERRSADWLTAGGYAGLEALSWQRRWARSQDEQPAEWAAERTLRPAGALGAFANAWLSERLFLRLSGHVRVEWLNEPCPPDLFCEGPFPPNPLPMSTVARLELGAMVFD